MRVVGIVVRRVEGFVRAIGDNVCQVGMNLTGVGLLKELLGFAFEIRNELVLFSNSYQKS